MDADAQPDPQAQLRKAIVQIMMDSTLTEAEKAQKRQALMMGGWAASKSGAEEKKDTGTASSGSTRLSGIIAAHGVGSLDENLKCGVCLNLCERPVTAPCQHNFCLACFNKWVNQGKRTCPTCRAPYGDHFARNPRINTALILALRIAKNPAKTKAVARADNESRPDQAYVTDRAVRAGLANAASGKIMVTTGNDHFGPIEAAHDPTRNRGVLVGDHWVNRLHCRQWGAHFPHVAGIAGQANTGAQSVVLSGGYEDDVDCGEWFLYTGSGGRDLSGNKRTSKIQSSDQVFEMMNKALLTSCLKGLPVRVVRSYKEKSTYAPTTDTPVRYDGVYRILRAWRKPGIQKQLVCRYLFMRCDNSPAPWSSEETGDGLSLELPEEAVKDMASAVGQVHSMTDTPYWDWVPSDKQWGWAKPSPSQGNTGGGTRKAINPAAKLRKALSEHEKALKEFRCLLCKDTLTDPLSTPCGHNFCKACLDKKFAGQGDVQPANASRSLRVRKVIKPCPACKADVCDFLSSAQVNR
ncbi:PUA-like domain-containing protein [Haematococcus lacustris]